MSFGSRSDQPRLKDEVLDRLADTYNVAQFLSFEPGRALRPRFSRLRGLPAGAEHASPQEGVAALLARSSPGTVNIRTFRPDQPKGNPFHYGLSTTDEVLAVVRDHTAHGLHVIVNETIDVADGGVSGVRAGGVTEFAPGGTPRIVEEPGACSLDDAMADALFETVYGVRPFLPHEPEYRVEFSLHPAPVGVRRQRWIVWEVAPVPNQALESQLSWPNRFSRHVGDKAFGLLMADLTALPVPSTLVLARALAPFQFGTVVGTDDLWLRTCPVEFSPGRYPTVRGWTDPFRLLADADPAGDRLASVLVQNGVSAEWSGAARSTSGELVIEGVRGTGEEFMLGLETPGALPEAVRDRVASLLRRAESTFGPIRMEWVADAERVWIVQLNQQARTDPVTVSPGEATDWIAYDPAAGLDVLHSVVDDARTRRAGVELSRAVGLTSHVGDILRAAKVPARIASVAPEQPSATLTEGSGSDPSATGDRDQPSPSER